MTGCESIQPIVETNNFIESGEQLPTWTLDNVLSTPEMPLDPVSPDDYSTHVSAYYFGHAT